MKITIEGETHNVKDWARATCTPAAIIHQRLAMGVPPYEAVFGHLSDEEEDNEMLRYHRTGLLDELDGRASLESVLLAQERFDLLAAYRGGRLCARRLVREEQPVLFGRR